MRKDIKLDMISADVIDPRSGLPRAATIAFAVSYTSRSPDQAMRVANELTTLFLNENLTERARLAQDASSVPAGREQPRQSAHHGARIKARDLQGKERRQPAGACVAEYRP